MWDLGSEISFDEATQGFQGHHYLKAKIKFKKLGDGYLIDYIGDGGFIFTMYQRTNPAPQKWAVLGFSPTQARVLFLFDQQFSTAPLRVTLVFGGEACTMALIFGG